MNSGKRLDEALHRIIAEGVPYRAALEQAIAGAYMDGVQDGRAVMNREVRADFESKDGRLGRVFDAVAIATIERCARVVMARTDLRPEGRDVLAAAIRAEMDQYAR